MLALLLSYNKLSTIFCGDQKIEEKGENLWQLDVIINSSEIFW